MKDQPFRPFWSSESFPGPPPARPPGSSLPLGGCQIRPLWAFSTLVYLENGFLWLPWTFLPKGYHTGHVWCPGRQYILNFLGCPSPSLCPGRSVWYSHSDENFPWPTSTSLCVSRGWLVFLWGTFWSVDTQGHRITFDRWSCRVGVRGFLPCHEGRTRFSLTSKVIPINLFVVATLKEEDCYRPLIFPATNDVCSLFLDTHVSTLSPVSLSLATALTLFLRDF